MKKITVRSVLIAALVLALLMIAAIIFLLFYAGSPGVAVPGAYMNYALLEPAVDAPVVPDMFFEDYGINPLVQTAEDPLSTFAVDVDTGAYTVARRYLTDGNLPPPEAIRVEEFINYFDQYYPRPARDAFAIHLEGAPSPYGGEDGRFHLVRIGLQGYIVPDDERPDALLIFVIDVSGSMDRENRLGLVKESLHLLLAQLRPTDRVGLVIYGSRAEVVLAPTPVADSRAIARAIDRLEPEGSTNAAEGLLKAYSLAFEHAQPGQISRLILCSDGVANVGETTAEEILEYAQEGISLSTFGFGMGNYNDVLMEQLADQGDGSYAYVDTIREAERLFVRDLTGTLLTIARDAKVQVEFNPAVVESYRLLGYENRDIADEDFRDDTVDGGEIGAGHTVTALYELALTADADPTATALTVYLRYIDPESNEPVELFRSLTPADFHARFEEASPRFQLTAVVAEFAELLRHSYWAEDNTLQALAADAEALLPGLSDDVDVQEFADLVRQAAQLTAREP